MIPTLCDCDETHSFAQNANEWGTLRDYVSHPPFLEIKRLEEACDECNEGGIRQQIEALDQGAEAEARARAIKTLGSGSRSP